MHVCVRIMFMYIAGSHLSPPWSRCGRSTGYPEVTISLPCSNYRPGEDDLQAFDFIRRFQLDVLEKEFPGVSKVRGSNSVQVAYRLDSSADLSLATR